MLFHAAVATAEAPVIAVLSLSARMAHRHAKTQAVATAHGTATTLPSRFARTGAELAVFTPKSGALRAKNPHFSPISPYESWAVLGPTPEGLVCEYFT